MGLCPARAELPQTTAVATAAPLASWATLVQGSLKEERAAKAWRRIAARLRGLFKLRRLFGQLGNHLKLFKDLKAK